MTASNLRSYINKGQHRFGSGSPCNSEPRPPSSYTQNARRHKHEGAGQRALAARRGRPARAAGRRGCGTGRPDGAARKIRNKQRRSSFRRAVERRLVARAAGQHVVIYCGTTDSRHAKSSKASSFRSAGPKEDYMYSTRTAASCETKILQYPECDHANVECSSQRNLEPL